MKHWGRGNRSHTCVTCKRLSGTPLHLPQISSPIHAGGPFKQIRNQLHPPPVADLKAGTCTQEAIGHEKALTLEGKTNISMIIDIITEGSGTWRTGTVPQSSNTKQLQKTLGHLADAT